MSIRDSNGRFIKGAASPNPGGRPKDTPNPRLTKGSILHQALLGELFTQADGDAVLFQTLILKHGEELKLDLSTALKLAKELAVYQSARKAPTDSKEEKDTTIILQYGFEDIIEEEENND